MMRVKMNRRREVGLVFPSRKMGLPSIERALVAFVAMIIAAMIALPALAQAQAGDPAAATHISSSAQATQEEAGQIVIGSGDLLSITVFDVPDLNQVVRVSERGYITLNLIGEIKVGGLTPAAAAKIVEEKLKQGQFVLHPQVAIMIQQYASQGVAVLGEVRRPGIYPVLGGQRLLDILSAAGGTTPYASPEITIKHRTGTQEVVTVQVPNNPEQQLAANVPLLPGDTVIVPRAGVVYVLGAVGRPGGFVMQMDGKITLLQALSLAAGVQRASKMNKTVILRKTATGYEETRIDLKKVLKAEISDVELHPDDIVYVPSSLWKSMLSGGSITSLAQSAGSAAIYHTLQ